MLILDEGRGVMPLRGHGSDRARALFTYAIAEKCGKALGVYRAGWGGGGVGGRTLEDRYGECSSIQCRSWWMDGLDKQLSEVDWLMEKLTGVIGAGVGFEGQVWRR